MQQRGVERCGWVVHSVVLWCVVVWCVVLCCVVLCCGVVWCVVLCCGTQQADYRPTRRHHCTASELNIAVTLPSSAGGMCGVTVILHSAS